MKGFIKTFVSIILFLSQGCTTIADTGDSFSNKEDFNFETKKIVDFRQKRINKLDKRNKMMNIKAKRIINLYKAWEITKGQKIRKEDKDIVVAVVDTGLNLNHQAFSHKQNLWVNKGETGFDKNGKDKRTNGIDDDGNGYVDDVHGANFIRKNGDIKDNHGHGTHIAGLIAGRDSESDFFGVAPYVKIMVLKYFDPKDPGNNGELTVDAFKYAVENGADIINFSGGGTDEIPAETTIIKEAEKKGVSVVVAAGNERALLDHEKLPKKFINNLKDSEHRTYRRIANDRGKSFYYPCVLGEVHQNYKEVTCTKDTDGDGIFDCKDNDIDGDQVLNKEDFDIFNKEIQTVVDADKSSILCVGALDLDKDLALFSNVGKRQVDIFAPGKDVISSVGGYYSTMNGTSQATAIATGVVALVKRMAPELSPFQIKNIINKTVKQNDNYKSLVKSSGVLDAYEAVSLAKKVRTYIDSHRANKKDNKEAKTNNN